VKSLKLGALIIFFILSGTGFLSAQEVPYTFSLGLGAEGNKNTLDGTAVAGVFTDDFAVTGHFSFGTRLAFSYNFEDLGTLEAEAMIRWYFLSRNSSGPFAQAGGGLSFIFWRDDTNDDLVNSFIYGGALGWRFRFGSFYVEPYARGGYPFMWGGGIIFGYSI
jgi:hypothetical protein